MIYQLVDEQRYFPGFEKLTMYQTGIPKSAKRMYETMLSVKAV